MLLRATKKSLLAAASVSSAAATAAHVYYQQWRGFGSDHRRSLRRSGGGRRDGAFDEGDDDAFGEDMGGRRKNSSRGSGRWKEDDFDDDEEWPRVQRQDGRHGRRDWADENSRRGFGDGQNRGAVKRGKSYGRDAYDEFDDQEFVSSNGRGSRRLARQERRDRTDRESHDGFRDSKRGRRFPQGDDDGGNNHRRGGFGSRQEPFVSRSSNGHGYNQGSRDWMENGVNPGSGKSRGSINDFKFDSDDDGGDDKDGEFNVEKVSGVSASSDLLGKSILEDFTSRGNDALFERDGKVKPDSAKIGESLLEKLKLGSTNHGGVSVDKAKGEVNEDVDRVEAAVTEADAPAPDADEIFSKMKKEGLIPNAVAMLDGLCKDGLVQEAMKLFGLMRETRTMPEVVVYTAVVDGYIKAAKLDDAKRIFKKMQTNGIVPNAFSYGVLIQGLCRGNRLDDAVELCIEMFEAGHSPNAATFVGLVDGHCKAKGTQEAARFVKSLQDRNFAIDGKSIRDHLDKKGPFTQDVSEAIFGRKT